MANRIPLIVNPAASQIQEFNESTDSLLGAIPIGGIIMWSGKIADIPTNYALCNGSNGTPDLRNKFVIAAHSDQTVGVTTAATTITGSNTVSGGSKDAVVVEHTHDLLYTQGAFGGTSGAVTPRDTGTTSGRISDAGVDGANKNLPPYYALAFIMRVS